MKHMDTKTQRAIEEAKSQYESIKDMIERLEKARDNGDDDEDDILDEIMESPLECQVRSGWASSSHDFEP